ncbi:metallophosphoesterase [Lactococcus lactis subsp. lactis]|uniref:Metallophosphoesterase n=1 Tax=Lactococcus lactis subsp. lactis TaxID=1360 RepID=A0A2Z3KET7_LACLL|nr:MULTISPECIES: metallophosphoesterase [Lactococcus]AWN65918.1 metallophosphoesterase [Lactococcus lactis subsp. lactis]MBK0028874.1 metallophosphoesterase [Lactococcus sp. S47]
MKAKNEISKERKETVETAIEIKQNNLEISQNLLEGRFELYPENRRRSVNKVIYQSQYFQLVYNLNHKSLAIESKGDLIYSAIPYDTGRNYIQKASIQAILHPNETRKYIESHENNLKKYLALSIFQLTGQRVALDSNEVKQAYQQIFMDPLFEMQVLGRMMQHDETGPLSANLAGKFLHSENRKTGISPYLAEYLKFVVEVTQNLPISTDGKNVHLLDSAHEQPKENVYLDQSKNLALSSQSDLKVGLENLPAPLKVEIENIQIAEPIKEVVTKPLLKSNVGNQLRNLRKNYVAHSQNPKDLEQYFENVHSTEDNNKINVISDIDSQDGKLPFSNPNFNILVGNISDSVVSDSKIQGIYVIGNHELSDILSDQKVFSKSQWDDFREKEWFKDLVLDPDQAWPKLPIGDNSFYELIKEELAQNYPKMKILNNESVIYEGVRYIGLTIPVALAKRKKELQNFIAIELKRLLAQDKQIPTVVVSHAPLFNELSMLSPKSSSYNKSYKCAHRGILSLFEDFNIIGAIHGHHHIPASSGQSKMVKFSNKNIFVVCSIYSKINTGFELAKLLPDTIMEKPLGLKKDKNY